MENRRNYNAGDCNKSQWIFMGKLSYYFINGNWSYFTLKLNFIQIRKFGEGLKQVTGSVNLDGKKADKNGMSSFQALATAVAAQVEQET